MKEMQEEKHEFRTYARTQVGAASLFAKAFLRWGVLALLVGGCGGAVGAVFAHAVEWATETRAENPWLLYLLPLGGIVLVAMYKLCRVTGMGTNEVFEGVRSKEGVPVLLAPAIFLGTAITHLLGGSAGREGAALQLGGSLSSFFGKVLKLSEKDRHILTMCGMAAVFSALFGTPVGACIFAVEVVHVGRFYSAALFPCMATSATAFGTAQLLGSKGERFPVELVPAFGLDAAWRVLVIAVLGAVVSVLFCRAMHVSDYLFARLLKNPFLRVAVGGVLLVGLSMLVGTSDYNGGGNAVIARVFETGAVRPEAFLLKILFTAVTIGAGFKGGEIVPTLFIGATFGGALAGLLGLSPAFGAAVGIAALFSGVTNCPVTTVVLCVELFGAGGLLFYAVAAMVSFLLSGYSSLYSGQQLMYSKLSDEEVLINGR